MPNKSELTNLYKLRQSRIKERLNEFSRVLNESNERIFEELCFCILTANSSAKSGIKSISHIKHLLLKGSKEQLQESLKEAKYRFPNKRAEYIVTTRNRLRQDISLNLKEKIRSTKDKEELRDYFVDNIKGFGYKEASHFLRNVGLSGYCILDKHIINTLYEFKMLNNSITPKNKKQYLEIESKMIQFAKNLNINIDELDLLLWSRKTGEILK
jgi:N-glycosylase/DNA lyase